MDVSGEESIAPEDLVSKCACCFKILKKQQKILSLNDELEATFCDVTQSEVILCVKLLSETLVKVSLGFGVGITGY